MMRITQIRERIQSEDYEVDPEAVAAAIVARLLGESQADAGIRPG